MASVLICTPAYGGVATVEYFQSVIGILDLCDAEGIVADVLCVGKEAAITRGRSNLATTFMQSDFQTLAFIDADIQIDPKDLLKLLRLDKPIRGAAVNLKTEDCSERLNAIKDGRRLKRKDMPPVPFEVDMIGGAVLLIDRPVFEKMSKIEWLQYEDEQLGPGVHYFHEMIKDQILLTEDFSFCERARECGFSIWCEPSVVVGHTGPFAWWG